MLGADAFQQLHVLIFSDDIDQRHIVFQADLYQHLAKVRSGCRMDEGGVALLTHGFHHSKGSERVHKTTRTLFSGDAFVHWQTLADLHQAIFGIHGAAQNRDGSAHQRLSGIACSRLNHFTRPLVAGRQRLPRTRTYETDHVVRNFSCHGWRIWRASKRSLAHICGAKEQTKVRWINWGCPNLH